MTTKFLDEFQHEFEQEQAGRLRRRVFWYCTVYLAFAVAFLPLVILLYQSPTENWRDFATWFLSLLTILFTAAYAVVEVRDVRSTDRSREQRLRRVNIFIALTAIVGSVTIFAVGVLAKGGFSLGILAFWQVFSIFFAHCTACLFLPWTWNESLRPFLPMYIINAVGMGALWIIKSEAFGPLSVLFIAFYGLTSVCAVLPGIGIAYWRHNRFAQEFTLKAVAGRYGEMRRELTGAQRIHEQLFPKPEVKGSVRFDYRYQPMRLLGGDYLYSRFIATDDREEPQLLCLLLDVTGHGIPAALTVNRLYGEIERLVAEDPSIAPTGLLRALNRYCFLTLSDHSLFVTAVAFRLDQTKGVLHYANAGHPPAYIRTCGVVRELEPTAMVLGVAKDLDVEVEDASVPFCAGDTLIAYTDGAMESRDRQGRMFNTDGIRDAMIAYMGGDCSMCHELINAVSRHRHGPLTDDTLVVEIACLAKPADAPAKPGAPDGHANGHTTAPSAGPSRTPASQPANTSAT